MTGLGLGILVLLACGIIGRILRRHCWRKPHHSGEEVVCSNCGYDLSRLSLPRCPECGALRGFRVPLDQLGLSEEEVRAGFEQQRQKRAERERTDTASNDDTGETAT